MMRHATARFIRTQLRMEAVILQLLSVLAAVGISSPVRMQSPFRRVSPAYARLGCHLAKDRTCRLLSAENRTKPPHMGHWTLDSFVGRA